MRRGILYAVLGLAGLLLVFSFGVFIGSANSQRELDKTVVSIRIARDASLVDRPPAASKEVTNGADEAAGRGRAGQPALRRERPAAASDEAAAVRACNFMRGSPQSSRPGVPCLPPPDIYPFRQNTPWRVELGERIVAAVTPDITELDCGGYVLFGDQTWCNRAMRGSDVFGLSFGIEERDLWSETMSNRFGVATRLFDCFIPPENSPPIAGKAPNATGAGGCSGTGMHCYQAPYWPYRICLGAELGELEGRMYVTLAEELRERPPLSVHLKIDVEGSEWTVLEQLLASEEDLAKVRSLDMEVHFGFNAASEHKFLHRSIQERIEREVRIMEDLQRKFWVTGSTLEVYRQGWRPSEDCPMHNCEEPFIHVVGGFNVQQFAVSYVSRQLVGSAAAGPGAAASAAAARKMREVLLERSAALAAAAPPPAPAPEPEPEPERLPNLPPEVAAKKYGFYIHAFQDPAAVIHQVRQLKRFFPGSPIYIMSDGGMDFSELCLLEGCTFELCPPANDRWHPWPFFRRIYDAAVTLQTEFVIMLEPDNTVHGPITRLPEHDAGGLRVNDRTFGMREYIEGLAQARKPGFKWTRRSQAAGLAGGAYFRREAILDAFSDENMMRIDWSYLAEQATKEVYSSDFAMQFALAARGWEIGPWDDCVQMDRDKYKPLVGPSDAAFRHYCSCYPGGKPTYNMRLHSQDQRLVKAPPVNYQALNSVCQLCYNLERYIENWGSARCTNQLSFNYSDLLMSRYHPEVKAGQCELPWLCRGK